MDPSRLKLGQKPFVPKKAPLKSPQPRKAGGKFLKGPIPLNWLSAAGLLPGKALHVGVALWFLSGVYRTNTVKLSNGVLVLFGVDRHAKYRALNFLENAGLITCKRQAGRSPVVTILPIGDEK